ncbi:hypothetical protein Leryth_001930 [Lithospermum erythrorhizon]|nr:hypothetical protein Leryth_001930 [Lithospermum erythrorhizon]
MATPLQEASISGQPEFPEIRRWKLFVHLFGVTISAAYNPIIPRVFRLDGNPPSGKHSISGQPEISRDRSDGSCVCICSGNDFSFLQWATCKSFRFGAGKPPSGKDNILLHFWIPKVFNSGKRLVTPIGKLRTTWCLPLSICKCSAEGE